MKTKKNKLGLSCAKLSLAEATCCTLVVLPSCLLGYLFAYLFSCKHSWLPRCLLPGWLAYLLILGCLFGVLLAFLLLATCYLLLATCYLHLATCDLHLAYASCYLLLATYYHLVGALLLTRGGWVGGVCY